MEQRAVLWTQALVRVPSVSGSPACLQVLETARDLIESTGVEADIRILFPEAPNPVLLARTGRGKAGVPELMLSGHVDVVPPAGMEDPWSARIEGDRMHGRGTTDMKSGAACARHFVKPLVKASTAYFGSFSLRMRKPRPKVSLEP